MAGGSRASAPAALDRLVERAIEAQQSESDAGTAPLRGPERSPDRRVVILHRAAGRMAGAGIALVVFAGILVFGLRRIDAPPSGIDEATKEVQGTDEAGDAARQSTSGSFVRIVPVNVDDLDPAERAILESFGGPLFGGPS